MISLPMPTEAPPAPLLQLGATADGEPFALPRDAATQKFAILARSGAGKTYAAGKLAEEMHAAGIPFVVLDPVGVWYGLRLAADGEGPGLPIPVFGGEYGDLPLDPNAGALVADLVVDRQLSLVLDVSSFRKHQRKAFVTEFAEHLFHRKKTARGPLHLFLEEAQAFVPQRTNAGDERMLGAFEDIGKIGRNYGIGLTLISQRPQAVNKDVLNQTEALIVLQLNAAQERKAVRDWIDSQGIDAGAAIDELPHLAIGEAIVWSPQWLKFFGRVRIGQKHTYNASATPTFDTAAVTPRRLDDAELASLRAAMQAAVTQAAQHDPKLLRARIAELERRLRERPARPAAEPRAHVAHLERLVQDVVRDLGLVVEQLQAAVQAIPPAPTAPAPLLASTPPAPTPPPAPTTPTPPPAPIDSPRPALARAAQRGAGATLKAGARKILQVLARHGTLTRQQLATLSGFAVSGGTFGTYLGTLRRSGLVVEYGGRLQTTAAAGAHVDMTLGPLTTDEVLADWRGVLKAGERSMLDELLRAYPRGITRRQLAERTGYERSGGTFSTYLGTLRRNGLVEVQREQIRASGTLFLKREEDGVRAPLRT